MAARRTGITVALVDWSLVLCVAIILSNHAQLSSARSLDGTDRVLVVVDGASGSDPVCKPGPLGPACKTIARGLRIAPSHATIMIEPGTYRGSENCNLSIIRPVTLSSSAGRDKTIVDCEQQSRCLAILANATIRGLTLRGGFVAPVANCDSDGRETNDSWTLHQDAFDAQTSSETQQKREIPRDKLVEFAGHAGPDTEPMIAKGSGILPTTTTDRSNQQRPKLRKVNASTSFFALLTLGLDGITRLGLQDADEPQLDRALLNLEVAEFAALQDAVARCASQFRDRTQTIPVKMSLDTPTEYEEATVTPTVRQHGSSHHGERGFIRKNARMQTDARRHSAVRMRASLFQTWEQDDLLRGHHRSLRSASSPPFNVREARVSAQAGGCILVTAQATVVDIRDVTIMDGVAPYGAGLAAMNVMHLTLSNVSITGNRGKWGGGMLAIGGKVWISSSTISNNSVTNQGTIVDWPTNAAVGGGVAVFGSGASFVSLSITSSFILNNRGTSCRASGCDAGPGAFCLEAVGGGLSAQGAIVSVSRSHVANNSLSSKHESLGGGILLVDGRLSVLSSHVADNSITCTGSECRSLGGGIGTIAGSVSVLSSYLTSNYLRGHSIGGGGLFAEVANVSVSSTHVASNHLSGSSVAGGGLFVILGTNLSVSSSHFTSNYLSGKTLVVGGGIASSGETVSVSSSFASGNSLRCTDPHCTGRGGGMLAQPADAGSGCSVSVSSSCVTHNSISCTGFECRTFGGGMTFGGNISVSSCHVASNYLSGHHALGGGLNVQGGGILTVSSSFVTSNSLSGNSSNGNSSNGLLNGGGLFVEDGHLFVSSCHVTENTLSCTGSKCQSAGGGIASPRGHISVRSSHVTSNSLIGESVIGGGFFVYGPGGSLSVSSSLVATNALICTGLNCSSAGGGIFADNIVVSVSSSDLANNSLAAAGQLSSVQGGGMWMCCGVMLSLYNVSVEMNRLVGDTGIVEGGGLWLSNSSGDSGSTFPSSQVHGREIRINRNTLMSVSSASASGGGVYAAGFVNQQVPISLQACTFSNNTVFAANALGGGASLVQSALVMDHCEVSHNTVTGWTRASNVLGGGLSLLGNVSMSQLTNCNVVHNTAGVSESGRGNGGGMFVGGRCNVSNMFLANNFADAHGGGVFLSNRAEFLFSGNATENVATSLGGTLFSEQDPFGQSLLSLKGHTVAADGWAFVIPALLSDAVEFQLTSLVCVQGSVINVTDDVAPRIQASVSPSNNFPTFLDVSIVSSTIKVIAVQCSPCPPGSYSLSGQSSTDRSGSFCMNCPFGGDCGNGGSNILGKRGFWGHASARGQVSFTRCPLGYCCNGEPCALGSCEGGRDGTLCGACSPGMGSAFFSPRCVADNRCHDASWAIPLFFVLILLYSCFLVFAPNSKTSSGVFTVTVFFYQVLPVVRGETEWEQARAWFISAVESLLLGGVSRSGEGNNSPGICVIPGMSTVLVVAANYLVPVSVCGVIGCWWLVTRLRWLRSRLMTRSSPCESWPEGLRNLHRTSPGWVAGLRLLLLSYSNLIFTSFSLLTCRTLAGSDQLVVFRQGTIACPAAWQVGPLLLAILLTLVPLTLLLWVRRNREQYPDIDVATSLGAGFAPGHQLWFAILLYQRWLLTLIYAFTSSALWRGMLQTVMCAVGLLLGVSHQPFRVATTQAFFVATLALLLIIAMLALPAEIKGSLASTASFGDDADNERALAGLQFVVALLPGCWVAVWVGTSKVWPTIRQVGVRVWSRRLILLKRGGRTKDHPLLSFQSGMDP